MPSQYPFSLLEAPPLRDPLLRDLAWAWLPLPGAVGTRSLIPFTGQTPATLGADVPWAPSQEMGFTIGSAANQQGSLPALTLYNLVAGKSALTLTARVRPTSISGTKYQRLIMTAAISNTAPFIWMNFNTTSSGAVLWGGRSRGNDGFSEVVGATSNQAGNWVTFTGIINLASAMLFIYRNGAWDGQAAGIFGASTFSTGTGTVQDFIGSGTAADSMLGHVSALLLHSRALSAPEIRALHRRLQLRGGLAVGPEWLPSYNVAPYASRGW